jgi:hypothetical protein
MCVYIWIFSSIYVVTYICIHTYIYVYKNYDMGVGVFAPEAG